MGAFFSNIQVHSLDKDPIIFRQNVIQNIIKRYLKKGYELVENENESDKSIIISSADNSPWIGIYDEEIEDQKIKKLDKLAADFSKDLNSTTLGVLVHDSDFTYLGLFKNGILIDKISNFDGKFDLDKNKSEEWKDLIIDRFSFQDIKSAVQKEFTFVEDILKVISIYLNLNQEHFLTGYDYISEAGLENIITLHFQNKNKKKKQELGATELGFMSGSGSFKFLLGAKEEREWHFTNEGDISCGFRVIIGGSCIDQNLVMPAIVNLRNLKNQEDKIIEIQQDFIEATSTNREKLYFADFSDFRFRKGFKPTYPMSKKEGNRYSKICLDSAISVKVNFLGLNIGKGVVKLWFIPIENPDGSFCTGDIEINVT